MPIGEGRRHGAFLGGEATWERLWARKCGLWWRYRVTVGLRFLCTEHTSHSHRALDDAPGGTQCLRASSGVTVVMLSSGSLPFVCYNRQSLCWEEPIKRQYSTVVQTGLCDQAAWVWILGTSQNRCVSGGLDMQIYHVCIPMNSLSVRMCGLVFQTTESTYTYFWIVNFLLYKKLP